MPYTYAVASGTGLVLQNNLANNLPIGGNGVSSGAQSGPGVAQSKSEGHSA